MRSMQYLLPLVLAGCSGSGAAAQTAQTADSDAKAIAGWELAVKQCSPCHVVATPPIRHLKGAPDGPDFQAVANGAKGSYDPLRTFMHSTHTNIRNPGAMPSMALTDDQIHDLAEYFSILRKQK